MHLLTKEVITVLALIVAVFGFLCTFWGKNLFKIMLAGGAFISISTLAGVLIYHFYQNDVINVITAAIIIGAIAGALTVPLHRFAVLCAGTAVSAFASAGIFVLAGSDINLIILVPVSILGGITFFSFEKNILQVVTSFGGSLAVVHAIAFFMAQRAPYTQWFDATEPMLSSGKRGILITAWLVLGILGWFIQHVLSMKDETDSLSDIKAQSLKRTQLHHIPDLNDDFKF